MPDDLTYDLETHRDDFCHIYISCGDISGYFAEICRPEGGRDPKYVYLKND